MASIAFTSGTIIPASWLNDVNAITYINPVQDVQTATAGQTVFALSKSPSALMLVQVFVNGLRYTPAVDYTIVGTVLTFLSGRTLADKVLVEYYA